SVKLAKGGTWSWRAASLVLIMKLLPMMNHLKPTIKAEWWIPGW
ncbi:hypothetical protein LINPERHAP2_LOCUS2892, partial [Linum perenne]